MSSTSAAADTSKKRERTESELDQPTDTAKRPKTTEHQTPSTQPAHYANYNIYVRPNGLPFQPIKRDLLPIADRQRLFSPMPSHYLALQPYPANGMYYELKSDIFAFLF